MTEGAPIRVGLIGAGVDRGWGWRSHVPALQQLPQYELAAVCTAHQDTAEAAARAAGASLAFSDYRELLARPDIDLVTIAVRVPWHREMVLAAAAAGKHVYCEWPLGRDLAEVEEMADAVRAAGVKAMPGLQGHAAPFTLYVKELIAEGFIGRPLTANARYSNTHNYMRPGLSWAAQRANANHILVIQAAHMLDIVSACLGGIDAVSASITTNLKQWPAHDDAGSLVDVDAPDCVMVHGRTDCGANVAAQFTFVPTIGLGWRFEIYGDEGVLVVSAPGPAMTSPDRVQGARRGEKELQDLPVPDHFNKAPAGIGGSAFHIAQSYVSLAEAIRGGAPYEPDFETARDVFRLISSVERSDEQDGRWVAVE